jgi:hypothetical protein
MEQNVLSIAALTISVCGIVIGAINHTRLRSQCCGRDIQASIDIERTTEPVKQPLPV